MSGCCHPTVEETFFFQLDEINASFTSIISSLESLCLIRNFKVIY